MSESAGREAFRKHLEALTAEYRRGLPDTIARVDARWNTLADGSAQPGDFAELLRELHSLAGAARTVGVRGVSEAAAAAEAFLEPYGASHAIADPAARAEFARLLGVLQQSAAAA